MPDPIHQPPRSQVSNKASDTASNKASDKPVFYMREGFIGHIVLNRPDERNSMTPDTLSAFVNAVDEARADTEARVLILTGKGSCFSAGAHLNSNFQVGDASQLPHERSLGMYTPFLAVRDLPVPVIAALNGHAVGGGFGLTLMADIRIANEDAKYGANFARLGIHSGMAISYVLPRLIGVSKASELLYTGRLVRGKEAALIGLVSKAVPQDQVLPEATALANEIAASAPMAVRHMKASLIAGLQWRLHESALAEAHLQSATLNTQDAKEGILAMREKRPPNFVGQ